MSGGYFQVEVGGLDHLLKQLHSGQTDMRSALRSMKDIGPKSTGAEELDNACDEFHDSWDNAIGKIADGVDRIEDKLRATKRAYEATEEAIRDAFHQGEAAQPAPSPSPRASSSGAGAR
ncbi:hypothetical protein [Streptomyces sp. NPDC051569]|uniref:hypothetical protein n=1 Tax=Streptomyces sp. NPDC051569 TaxID=3365661 RepID=UPI0037A39F91